MGLARLYGLTSESADGDGNPAVGYGGGDFQSGRLNDQAASSTETIILRGHERLYYCNEMAYPAGMTVAEMVKLLNTQKGDDALTLPIRVKAGDVLTTDGGMMVSIIDWDASKSGQQDLPADKGLVLDGVTQHASGIDTNNHKPGTHVHGKSNDDKQTPPRETDSLLPFPPLDVKVGVPNLDLEPGPGRGFSGTIYPGEAKTHPVADIDFKDEAKAPSLLKSFRERGGKGLPGVITAIDLGNFVSDDSTWGVEQGYRAPKFLEITIAFSPLHEIPPGLDSEGQITSAQYGVGGSRAYNKGDL
jgi:hypothetical protein